MPKEGFALVEAAIDLAGVAKELTGALPPTITQQSWKVWVRLGLTELGDYIEDITIYDCAEKPGYVLGRVTIDNVLRSSTMATFQLDDETMRNINQQRGAQGLPPIDVRTAVQLLAQASPDQKQDYVTFLVNYGS